MSKYSIFSLKKIFGQLFIPMELHYFQEARQEHNKQIITIQLLKTVSLMKYLFLISKWTLYTV